MRKLWFLFIYMLSALAGVAQSNGHNTFLWRVYKPGVTKPSFVFGTMHVTDSRAFNFKDSLYYYLEQSDAFAMEVHPDSFNLAIKAAREGKNEKRETETGAGYLDRYEKLEESLDKKTVAKIREKFKAELGDKKMTKSELADFLLERFVDGQNKKKKPGETMNTFMDAYLYNMAEQQGKVVVGLESVTMQIGLVDRLGRGIRLENIGKLVEAWDLTEESPVHSLYYREKFDSIGEIYTLLFTPEKNEEFLYNRNRVMVRGMDSIIGNGKVLFTAVGVAHLPGENGVINLLRQKGYRVEPVFSNVRIPASEYSKGKLRNRTWTVYDNAQAGFRYELPGKITEEEMAKGERIAYYYDIGSGFLYTVRSGRLSISEQKRKPDLVISSHLLRICVEVGGIPGTKTDIEQSGLKGKEAYVNQGKTYYSRYREFVDSNMFYILTVTASKKEFLSAPEPEQFFASFKTRPVPAPVWTPFHSPVDGFRINLPGSPREETEKADSGSSVQTNSLTFFEKKTGINYSVSSIRTINNNEYINTDPEVFFEDYLEQIKKQFKGKEVRVQDTLIHGYHGKLITSGYTDNNQLRGLLLRRHNMSYYVLAEYDTSARNRASVDQYLSSFSLAPFKTAEWSMQEPAGADIRISLPARPDTLEQIQINRPSWQAKKEYIAQDPYSSVIYKLGKIPLGPYFWAANEDSVYSFIREQEIQSWSDSVIAYQPVTIAGKTGRELILQDKSDRSRSVIRFLLNGTHYYRLAAPVMPSFDDEKSRERFLSSLELLKPESSEVLYQRTAEKLFTDLQSADSVVYAGASTALEQVRFTGKDIPLLLEKMRNIYPQSEEEYYTVYDKLTEKIQRLLKQPENEALRQQVRAFASAHYTDTGSVAASNRFRLLNLLVTEKTTTAYEQVLALMEKQLPARGHGFSLYNHLYDSLTLTKILFPGLLKYVADTTNGLQIISLAKTLLDSNLLSRDQLVTVAPGLIIQAKTQLKKLVKEPADSYSWHGEVNELLVLLEQLKRPETPALLNDYLRVKIPAIKKQAAISLLALGKKVPASVLEKLAAEKELRVELYQDLGKINQQALYPAAYRDQYSMAEAYLYNALISYEYEPETFSVSFIKKKEIETGERKGVYYLFRVDIEPDEESEESSSSYLGIAGPFSPEGTVMLIPEDQDLCGLYQEEAFDGYRTDQQLEAYIRDYLEWIKKDEL